MYQNSGLSQGTEEILNTTDIEDSLILEGYQGNNCSSVTKVAEENVTLIYFQDKSKTPNIIINIEEGLILEHGWENLVVYEANDALPEDNIELEPRFKNTETEIKVIDDPKENDDKENTEKKTIDEKFGRKSDEKESDQ